jgi:hypothetical protein
MNLINWSIIVLLIGITIYLCKMMPIESFTTCSPTSTSKNSEITDIQFQYDNNNVVVYGYNTSTESKTLTLSCTIDSDSSKKSSSFELPKEGFFSAKMNMPLERNEDQTLNCTLTDTTKTELGNGNIKIPKKKITNLELKKNNKCRIDGSSQPIFGPDPTYENLPNISQTYSDDNSSMNLDDLYNEVTGPSVNIFNLNIEDNDGNSFNKKIKQLINQFK